MVGVPAGCLPYVDDVFVANLGWMAIVLHMVFVLFAALDIHVARVPVTIFDCGLGSPVRPDAELGIAKPIRRLVGLQGFARPLISPGCDLQLLRKDPRVEGDCRSRGSKKPECVSSCECHVVSLPSLIASLIRQAVDGKDGSLLHRINLISLGAPLWSRRWRFLRPREASGRSRSGCTRLRERAALRLSLRGVPAA